MMPDAESTAPPDAILRPRELGAAVPHDWHWPEYGAELAGTAWNVGIGLSAVVFNFAPGMPGARLVPDSSLRLWLTGLIFAGSGSLFTISPWGRLSGAHINPSVTLGFWAQGRMRRHDLLGYLGAQFLGGVLGVLVLCVVWGRHAAAVHNGMTLPGQGYTAGQAFCAESLMTFSYMLGIFHFVSHPRLVRWTPLMNWVVVAGLVWLGAGVSGTSLNPARSFGPALFSADWHGLWIYLLAPPLGALLAAGFFRLILSNRVLITAKLSHSPLYRTIFRHHRAQSPTAPAAVVL
jgi:aquaporin Z